MGYFELLIVLLDIVTIWYILRTGLSKTAKLIYVLLVIFLPILGMVLFYLIYYLGRSGIKK